MRVMRSTPTEDPRKSQRESPKRKHAQESQGGGQRRGPRRSGAKQRDCDGKKQPQLTSRAHGAAANGLKREIEEPGGCQDDESTTCGRKRAGQERGARGQQFEPEWTVTQPGREGEERMMFRVAPQRWVGRFRNTRE